MKRNILFLFVAALAVAGCWSNNASVGSVGSVGYDDCVNCGGAQVVKYSMPHGNDLVLETGRHVIQVEAEPGKQYDYYIWTGEKNYDDDPDLVIQDGVAAVLTVE